MIKCPEEDCLGELKLFYYSPRHDRYICNCCGSIYSVNKKKGQKLRLKKRKSK